VQLFTVVTDELNDGVEPDGQLQPPVLALTILHCVGGAGLPPLQLLAVYVVFL